MRHWLAGFIIVIVSGLMIANVAAEPLKANNVCQIFQEHPGWYISAKQTEQKWGVPVPVQMAIMKQESHFDSDAKNPHSSAYGYAQVLNGTWHVYQKDVDSDSKRDNFKASSDFIGWYATKMQEQAGVSPKNAYQVYLAYYNGIGEYKHDARSHHFHNAQLARNVQATAERYNQQLETKCSVTLWDQVVSLKNNDNKT